MDVTECLLLEGYVVNICGNVDEFINAILHSFQKKSFD